MIRMLVGDQNSVNILSCQFQFIQPLFHTFPADAHIYQKMGINSQQELISIVDSTEVVYQ